MRYICVTIELHRLFAFHRLCVNSRGYLMKIMYKFEQLFLNCWIWVCRVAAVTIVSSNSWNLPCIFFVFFTSSNQWKVKVLEWPHAQVGTVLSYTLALAGLIPPTSVMPNWPVILLHKFPTAFNCSIRELSYFLSSVLTVNLMLWV